MGNYGFNIYYIMDSRRQCTNLYVTHKDVYKTPIGKKQNIKKINDQKDNPAPVKKVQNVIDDAVSVDDSSRDCW